MPIKGDRLRWPPRPGKKFSAVAAPSGSRRRSLSTNQQSTTTHDPLPQPNDHDETAVRPSNAPREVIEQAHDDAESGKEDTDGRHQTAQVLNRRPDD
jgi:hypothetical protein